MGIAYEAIRIAGAMSQGGQQPGPGGQTTAGEAEAARKKAAEERKEHAAEQMEAANLPRMLSEAARYLGSYISATAPQIDTMALVAAVSAVADPATLVSVPRVIFTAKEPEAGKTHSAKLTLSLCYNPMNTTGSWPGVKAGIAEYAQAGSQCPTFFRDEIQKVFGGNGLGDGGELGDIIRQGYVCDATQAWSVNRQRVEFSTFSIFLMTGLRAAIPTDIRTRCIVLNMVPGESPQYYDLREARERAKKLAVSLGRAVRGNRDFIRAFRVRSIGHPKLIKRKGEVWEPLFAVAAAADAQSGTDTWRKRALAAFLEVALGESETMTLSPAQETVRDVATATEMVELRTWHGEDFAGGKALRDALREVDPDAYGRLTDDVLGCRMRDDLTDEYGEPIRSVQVRFGAKLVRGYLVRDLLAAWDAIRPRDPDEMEDAEFADPFADEDADEEMEDAEAA